jgi:hypothetical protein
MNHCVSKSPAYTVIDFVSLCVQERVAILIINGHAVLVTARPIIPRGHYSISRSIIASTAVSNNPTGSKWRYPATIPTAKSATRAEQRRDTKFPARYVPVQSMVYMSWVPSEIIPEWSCLHFNGVGPR